MDKTAWIVVSACIGLLAFNIFTSSEDKEKKAASTTAATAPATIPTEATQPSSTSADASPTAPIASAENAITQPVTAIAAPVAAAPQEIASLTSYSSKGEPVVRYSIQNIGGSIKDVQMIGKALNSTKPEFKDDVRINHGAAHGIGTLMFDLSAHQAARFDTANYEVVKATKDEVTLKAKVGHLLIIKTFRLKPLTLATSEKPVEGLAYALSMNVIIRNDSNVAREAKNWGIYAGLSAPISPAEASNYTYFITYADKSFDKESTGYFKPWFSDDKDRDYKTGIENLTWAGTMNQYYASIVIPQGNAATSSIYTSPVKVQYPVTGESTDALELGIGMPNFQLSAATADMPAVPQSFTYELFTGPKLNILLGEMDEKSPEHKGIDLIMDYGAILGLLSYPMNWLINVFHGWMGNWGWAIVCMTLVIRIIIWPLYRKSYMSMKRMSLLQPMMKELKEKHPDNPQKVNMEMMKLYKEYGISPIGGCLPMLLQIPIFFAFFYVLQTSAEFRGAPFIGWVTDLSQMDTVASFALFGFTIPVNVLPFVMVITMIVQMRMTPQAGDPTQQKIMRLMPLMFFVFCYTYPSALALYWTTQNIISIAQTWFIQRVPVPELQKVARKAGGKKGFFERMIEAQQATLAEQQKKAKEGNNMRNVTRK